MDAEETLAERVLREVLAELPRSSMTESRRVRVQQAWTEGEDVICVLYRFPGVAPLIGLRRRVQHATPFEEEVEQIVNFEIGEPLGTWFDPDLVRDGIFWWDGGPPPGFTWAHRQVAAARLEARSNEGNNGRPGGRNRTTSLGFEGGPSSHKRLIDRRLFRPAERQTWTARSLFGVNLLFAIGYLWGLNIALSAGQPIHLRVIGWSMVVASSLSFASFGLWFWPDPLNRPWWLATRFRRTARYCVRFLWLVPVLIAMSAWLVARL